MEGLGTLLKVAPIKWRNIMKRLQGLALAFMLLMIALGLASVLATSPMAIAQNNPTTTPEPDSTEEDVELPLSTPENIPTSVPAPVGGKGAVPRVNPQPKLARPLARGQALRKALEFEQRGVAEWQDEAWSLETLKSHPDRITIEHFDAGKYEPLGTNVEGALWVVTIRGRVRMAGIGWGCLCSGATYAISEETGNVVYWSAVGPPLGANWGSYP